jgi:Flp pilus assembly protein TadG
MRNARTRWITAGLRDTRAAALVESALVGFVYFLTVFGTIELGVAVWKYNMVANLAQEGARWAMVRGQKSSMPATASDVHTFVQSRAPFAVTVTTTPAPSTTLAGGLVAVRVETTFTPVSGIIPQSVLTLSSTARMIVSR